METLLTIAGFDPSSGAGVTADLAVFAAHGFFGTSAITALTVQSTVGVKSVHPVDSITLLETLRCLANDLPPAGVKLGMLATEANVRTVATFLGELKDSRQGTPVVLDPVLRSSSGRDLLSQAGLGALREELLPLVDWVTPNRQELAVLTGMPVATEDEIEAAAASLLARQPNLSVVVTGGDGERADDLLMHTGERQWLRADTIVSNATHGTGCAFSSALLCATSLRMNMLQAISHAKVYVRQAIRQAPGLGAGRGPLHLLWPLREVEP